MTCILVSLVTNQRKSKEWPNLSGYERHFVVTCDVIKGTLFTDRITVGVRSVGTDWRLLQTLTLFQTED